MAEKTPSDLKGLLTCSICLGQYREPKTLPCHHCFCKECLESMFVPGRGLTCPTCQQSTQISKLGIRTLPDSFLVNNLLKQLGTVQGTVVCSQHKKSLDIYCHTCQRLYCHSCTYHNHKGHSLSMVTDVYEQHKLQIEEGIQQIQHNYAAINDANSALHSTIKGVRRQRAIAMQQIDVFAHSLKQEVDRISEEKVATLALQKTKCQAALTQMQNCKEYTKHSLSVGCQQLTVATQPQMIAGIRACSTISGEDFKPSEKADLVFQYSGKTSELLSYTLNGHSE